MWHRRVTRGLFPLTWLLGLVIWGACSEGPTGPTPVDSVTVTAPSAASLAYGASVSLSAAVRSASGSPLTDRPVTWESSDTSLATVSASGLVTARINATATDAPVTIAATSGGVRGTLQLLVQPAPVTSVQLSAEQVSVVTGAGQQLVVTVLGPEGRTFTSRAVTWGSRDSSIATVSGTGSMSSVFYAGPGSRTTRIVASAGGQSDSLTVVVTEAPVASVVASAPASTFGELDSLQLVAELRSTTNAVLTGRPVVWSALDDSVATVSSTGRAQGARRLSSQTLSARFVATSGALADTVQVSVVAWPAPFVLTPSAGSVASGTAFTLSVADASASAAISITAGGNPVAFSVVDASTLAVVMPAGAAGPLQFDVSAPAVDEVRRGAAVVTREPLPLPADPLAFGDSLLQALDSTVAEAAGGSPGLGVSPSDFAADVALVQSLADSARAAFALLTSEQRQLVAATIAALSQTPSALRLAAPGPIDHAEEPTNCRASRAAAEDCLEGAAEYFRSVNASLRKNLRAGIAGGLLIAYGGPLALPGVFIAGFSAANLAETLVDAHAEILDRVTAPAVLESFGITSTPEGLSAAQEPRRFQVGVAQTIPLTLVTRNPLAGDVAIEGLAPFFTGLGQVSVLWDSTMALLPRVLRIEKPALLSVGSVTLTSDVTAEDILASVNAPAGITADIQIVNGAAQVTLNGDPGPSGTGVEIVLRMFGRSGDVREVRIPALLERERIPRITGVSLAPRCPLVMSTQYGRDGTGAAVGYNGQPTPCQVRWFGNGASRFHIAGLVIQNPADQWYAFNGGIMLGLVGAMHDMQLTLDVPLSAPLVNVSGLRQLPDFWAYAQNPFVASPWTYELRCPTATGANPAQSRDDLGNAPLCSQHGLFSTDGGSRLIAGEQVSGNVVSMDVVGDFAHLSSFVDVYIALVRRPGDPAANMPPWAESTWSNYDWRESEGGSITRARTNYFLLRPATVIP